MERLAGRARRRSSGLGRRRLLVGGLTLSGAAAFASACGSDTKKETRTTAPAGQGTQVVGAATAAPVGTAAVAGQIQRGGVIRGVGPQVYDSVDVHRASGDPTLWLSNQILSKLVWYKNSDAGEIEPDVSASYEALDGANYIFKLRQGVKWHNRPPANGREFVAEDVKWHIERQASGKLKDGTETPDMRRQAFYKTVTRIETPDKYTIRLTLNQPNGSFLDRLASYFSTIPNREAMERFEADHRKLNEEAMIGTGPYVLTHWRPSEEVRMRRNPDYFRKDEPITDGQIWTVLFEDPNARRAAFEQKQLDQFDSPDPTITRSIINASRGAMYEVLTGVGNTVALFLNMNKQFKDIRLVQAMNMAIDRRQLIQTFHQGLGQVSGWVTWIQEGFAIPPDDLVKMPGYRTDRELEKREARQLWAAGGGPALGEVDIRVPDTWLAQWPDTTQILPKMFNDNLGVTQFKTTKTSYNEEIIPNLTRGEYPNWFGWIAQVNSPDPREDLRRSFFANSTSNYNKVNNPQLEAILDEASQIVDLKRAVAKVREAQNIIMENAQYGIIRLYNYIAVLAFWNYFKGLLKQQPSAGKPGTAFNIYSGHLTGSKVWLDTRDPSYQGRPPATVN